MKQARPPEAQIQALIDFLNMLEGMMDSGVYPDDQKIGDDTNAAFNHIQKEWQRVSLCWMRVVFGGAVCIENACDPNESALEFKPEIKLAMEQHERLTAALHHWRVHPDYSYVTVPAGSDPTSRLPFLESIWERCPEAEVAGSGDEVWRRRKE